VNGPAKGKIQAPQSDCGPIQTSLAGGIEDDGRQGIDAYPDCSEHSAHAVSCLMKNKIKMVIFSFNLP
jgi:hypothetical protein